MTPLSETFVQEPWASGKMFRQVPDTPDASSARGQLETRFQRSLSEGTPPRQLRYHEV